MDLYTFNYYYLKCSICKLPTTSSSSSTRLEEAEFTLKAEVLKTFRSVSQQHGGSWGRPPYCETHVSLLWSEAVDTPEHCQDSVFVGKTFILLRTSCADFPSMPCMSQTKR